MEAAVDIMAFTPSQQGHLFLSVSKTLKNKNAASVINLIKPDPQLTKGTCSVSLIFSVVMLPHSWSSSPWSVMKKGAAESSTFLWVTFRGSWVKAASQQRSKQSHSHKWGTWNPVESRSEYHPSHQVMHCSITELAPATINAINTCTYSAINSPVRVGSNYWCYIPVDVI